MDRYDAAALIGLAAMTTGIYLTIGLGPALIVFGGLLVAASWIASLGSGTNE